TMRGERHHAAGVIWPFSGYCCPSRSCRETGTWPSAPGRGAAGEPVREPHVGPEDQPVTVGDGEPDVQRRQVMAPVGGAAIVQVDHGRDEQYDVDERCHDEQHGAGPADPEHILDDQLRDEEHPEADLAGQLRPAYDRTNEELAACRGYV